MYNDRFKMLAALAEKRHGVFTLAQARSVGIPPNTITSRAAAGIYERVAPSVYLVGGAPPTTAAEIAAAVASFPDLAAASHQTAAEIWGLTNRGIRSIEVVTTRWDRVHRPDLVVHESLDLLEIDITEVDGIAVTKPARTVVDLGAVNKWIVEHALEQGIRQGLFTLDEVGEFVARVAKRGRRGVGIIRPLLESRRRWDTTTESALEDVFRKVIADFDMDEPVPQYVIHDEAGAFVCRADFAYPDERILIELDSEAHHLDRISFRRDRSKQNRAVSLGWTVLRYTWWDLVDHPYVVKQQIIDTRSGVSGINTSPSDTQEPEGTEPV